MAHSRSERVEVHASCGAEHAQRVGVKRVPGVSLLLCLLLLLPLRGSAQSTTFPTITQSSFSTSGTGDKTLVAATSGKRIRVYRLFVNCSASTTLILKDSSGNVWMPAVSATNLFFDLSEVPWFAAATGSGLILNQGQSATCTGGAYYNVN